MGQYFAAIAAYGYNIGWGERLGTHYREVREECDDAEEAVRKTLAEAGMDMGQHGLGTTFMGNSFMGTGSTLLVSRYIEAFQAEPFDPEEKGAGAQLLTEAMRILGAPEEMVTAGPAWILGGWVY